MPSVKTATLSFWPLLLIACTGEPVNPPGPPGPPASPGAQPEATAAPLNVVDRVVAPMLTRSGRKIAVEDPVALCRRAAIDLNGITPSQAEVEARCAGRTPAQIVHYFMNKPSAAHVPDGSPPYLFVNRRAWADTFRYEVINSNTTKTFYGEVMQLDKLVGDLYAGKLGYDAFAVEALASAAFTRRFGIYNNVRDYPAIAAAAFHIFLGREALPSEAADFGNLWRPFDIISVPQATAEQLYPSCRVNARCVHVGVGVRGNACAGTNALLCQSTVLGAARVSTQATALTHLSQVSAADAAQLRTAGRLIVAQRQFAEAAVDMVLRKYLGWWDAGAYRPDYNLPAVRDALVAFFIERKYSVRDLEREVLTSLLYTQPQRRGDDIAEAPLWAFGPTRQVSAEVLLDTIGAAAGVALGGCDFRFAAGLSVNGRLEGANRLVDAWDFPVTPGVAASFYMNTARRLGGCPSGGERGDATGVVPALGLREALNTAVCAHPAALSALTPPGLSGLPVRDGLARLLSHQVRAVTGAAPTQEETAAFVDLAAAEGCASSGSGGQCDYQKVGAQLCMALFASSMVNFY